MITNGAVLDSACMSAPNFSVTVEHLSSRLSAGHVAVAHAWLERLDAILPVDKRDVFPTAQLLDHIPDLIRAMAQYMRAPADLEIEANTAVMAKAQELGLLRVRQEASVHQLLREYQLLAEVLEDFFVKETVSLGARADAIAAVLLMGRVQRAIGVWQRQTVDAFVTHDSDETAVKAAKIRHLSRLVVRQMQAPLATLQALEQAPPRDTTPAEWTAGLRQSRLRLGSAATMLVQLERLSADIDSSEVAIDLTALVADIASRLADMAAQRNVQIAIDEGLPVIVSNPGRVELVLLNVVANAIRYADPAKPMRTVRVGHDPADSEHVIVTVADNGVGISAAMLAALDDLPAFDVMTDDDAMTSGLGLAIVRESMAAMAGDVVVESVEGEGATVRLRWPASAHRESVAG